MRVTGQRRMARSPFREKRRPLPRTHGPYLILIASSRRICRRNLFVTLKVDEPPRYQESFQWELGARRQGAFLVRA